MGVRLRPLADCSGSSVLVGVGVLTSSVGRRQASQEPNQNVHAAVPCPRQACRGLAARPIGRSPVSALALMIRPTRNGWAVCLSNGQELVHYRGPFSKRLAMRYLERYIRGI